MRQGNKLNLASNSANEHKRLSSMEIFFLNTRQVSLWSRSGLANEIHYNPDGMESVTVLYNKNLLNVLYRYSHCHFACKSALSIYIELLYAETAALGRADAFLPVARASSVGAVTHQLEIVRSSTERWSKLARI